MGLWQLTDLSTSEVPRGITPQKLNLNSSIFVSGQKSRISTMAQQSRAEKQMMHVIVCSIGAYFFIISLIPYQVYDTVNRTTKFYMLLTKKKMLPLADI